MGESGRDDDENLLLGVVHLGHTHGNYFWWDKHHCVKFPITWCTSSEKLSNWVSLDNTHENHLLCCKWHCVKCPITWCTSSQKLSNWVSLGNTHESHLFCCKWQCIKRWSSLSIVQFNHLNINMVKP